MTDTPPIPLPPAVTEVLYDNAGRAYVPLYPSPGLMSVPVTLLELVELWRLSVQASAFCASQSRSEEWAYHTERAQHLLGRAREMNPQLVRMFEDAPHYGSEGKA